MATQQILDVQINDTDPHDYMFHLPDQRVKQVTIWLENLDPFKLGALVLIQNVNPDTPVTAYPLGKTWVAEASDDGKAAIIYNSAPLWGIYDIGLRLQYSQTPAADQTEGKMMAQGSLMLSAYAEAGAL